MSEEFRWPMHILTFFPASKQHSVVEVKYTTAVDVLNI
jgi:hypothetical protein